MRAHKYNARVCRVFKETHASILVAVRDVLRNNGWYVIKHQAGPLSHPGLSDRSAIRNGKTIYVEVKAGKDKQSLDQMEFAEMIKIRGGEYIIIRSADDAVKMFNGR